MEVIVIQKAMPIPPARKGGLGLPLDQLEVGDSFVTPSHVNSCKKLTSALGKASNKLGRKFTRRMVTKTSWRVWRTA